MSIEQNKALFSQFIEALFNQGNISAVDGILSPDFIESEQLPPGIPRNREGVKLLTTALRGAFPDLHVTIHDLIAEGDKVVANCTWSGTQKGEFMGMPATGRHMSITVIDIVRFAGGKVVEHWGVMDSAGMMQQLSA